MFNHVYGNHMNFISVIYNSNLFFFFLFTFVFFYFSIKHFSVSRFLGSGNVTIFLWPSSTIDSSASKIQ